MQIDKDQGLVVLEHETDVLVGGQMKKIVWRTEYRHMQNIGREENGVLVDWIIGEEVDALTQMGEIGTIAIVEGQHSHLHFEVVVDGVAINLDNLLSYNSIATHLQ